MPFSILGALLLSVTLAPVLCSFFFGNKTEEKETLIDRIMKWVYSRVLNHVLRFRLAFLILMAGLLAATVALVPHLGGEFMPELEEGNLWIRALLPRTVSREEAARLAPKLRSVIASVPEIRGVMSQVGRPDDGTDVTSFFNLEFNAPLKPMEEWRPGMTRLKIEDELMDKFQDFSGISFNFSQLIRDNIDEALSGIKGANSVKLIGSDLETLEATAERIVGILRSIPGIDNVGVFHIVGQPNLEIKVNRRACARYGINVDDVEDAIAVAIGGQAFSEMVEGKSGTTLSSACRRTSATTPATSREFRSISRDATARRGRGFRSRTWRRSSRTRSGRRTSTARTTAATSRSSSASTVATSPRRSMTLRSASAIPTSEPNYRRVTGSSGRGSSPRWRRPTSDWP